MFRMDWKNIDGDQAYLDLEGARLWLTYDARTRNYTVFLVSDTYTVPHRTFDSETLEDARQRAVEYAIDSLVNITWGVSQTIAKLTRVRNPHA